MGGEIEAASVPRRGSTFTVRLPLATAGEPAGQPAPAAAAERGATGTGEHPAGQAPGRVRADDPLCRSS